MSSQDIDTRSDIYSLGVLLYELLTGRTPHDASQLLRAGIDHMRRIIREQEPALPSTRLSTLDDVSLHKVASRRRVEPAKLVSKIRGDLDWIVMKALEKDRSRRYDTAIGFGLDVERFLRNEPITARPQGSWYRTAKLIKRNKFAFASAAVVAISLIGGLGVSVWMYVNEKTAYHRASAAEQEQTRLRDEAETEREIAEKRAYAADMDLASRSANETNGLASVENFLSLWRGQKTDRRGWEWYYLNALCHRDRMTIIGDAGGLTSIAWNPKADLLASSGLDNLVKIWDTRSGEKILDLQGTWNSTMFVVWDPKGERLLSGGWDGSVTIWNFKDTNDVTKLDGFSKPVRCGNWCASGDKIAAADASGLVKIWDPRTGSLLQHFEIHNTPNKLVWKKDGTRLAIACMAENIKVWDARTGLMDSNIDVKTPVHGRAVGLDCSPDNKWLASGGDDALIRFWNASNGTNYIFARRRGSITFEKWSPDGQFFAATGAGENKIEIWHAENGKLLNEFRGHHGTPRCLSWSPDSSQIASSGMDGTIKFWDVKGSDPSTVYHMESEPSPSALDWSRDGRYQAAGGSEGRVVIWNEAAHEAPTFTIASTNTVNAVRWNPRFPWLAISRGPDFVSIWDQSAQREIRQIPIGRTALRALDWNPAGDRFVSSGSGRDIHIWDANNGQVIASGEISLDFSFAISWSPDGKYIAAGMISAIGIFDPTTLQLIRTLRGHRELVRKLAWSPDSKCVASCSDDFTARVWDVETGRELSVLIGHGGAVSALDWSRDGNRIATGSWDRSVKVWDPANGTELFTLGSNVTRAGPVMALAWSPDSSRLACASGYGHVMVLDARRGYAAEKQFAERHATNGLVWRAN